MGLSLDRESEQSTVLPVPDFRALFESAPNAFLVLLPDDPVFTIVAVSNAYLRVSGVRREEILGRGIFAVFPSNPDDATADGERSLRASLRRSILTRIPDSMPAYRYDIERISQEGSRFEERYWRTINTPLVSGDGDLQYLLHSVEEVTEKVLAEEKADAVERQLKASEKRFRQLAENSGFGVAIETLAGTLSYVNRTLLQLLGYTEEEVAAGLLPWDRLTPLAYASSDEEARRQVFANGRCAPYEKVYVAKDGRHVPILIGASLLEAVNSGTEVAVFVLDLTRRKQSERENAFLVRLDDATRPLIDPDEIVLRTARLLGEFLGADRCGYCRFESDQATLEICGDFTRPGVPSIAGRYLLSQFGAEAVRLLQGNQPQVIEDIEADPAMVDGRAAYRSIGIRAHLSVPLHKAGRLVAAIGVHQQTPRKWLRKEVELVRVVANRCWESLERVQITRALQASEQRLRLAQRVGRIGSFEWWVKENRTIWTPELEALYGLGEGTFEGSFDDWRRRVAAEDVDRVVAGIRSCIEARAPEHTFEFRALLPDGTQRWLKGQGQFFYNESGAAERMVGVNIDIDAQKKAEARLHQQWQAFDTALSNTPDLNYTFDVERRFIYANAALLRLWQRPLEDVVGKNFLELGYEHDLGVRLDSQVHQVIDTKQPVRDHTPYAGASGEMRHFEYIFSPVFAADGQVEAVAGSTRDITEQKKSEELIEEDRRRWRELLLQTPAAIAVLRGPDHRYQWVNGDYLRLVGRSADSLVGRAVRDALPELISQGYVEMFDHVYQTGEPHHASEAPVLLGEGDLNELYVNFVCLPTRSSQGEIDGTFVHATDVTDLVRARKKVEDSEREFRTLAQTIPQLIWTAKPDGSIEYLSEQWAEYIGLPPERLYDWGWQQVVHPEDLPGTLDQWTKSIQTGEPLEMRHRFRHHTGEWRWQLVRGTTIKDETGAVIKWTGTCTDIDDQRKTEEELRRINRELEEFAYVSSHDLQEPLRMVNIYTDLMLRRIGATDEKLNQYAGFVRGGVTRMEALIQDLLQFSRTVHSEEQAAGTADLSASMSEALAVLNNVIEETGAVIKVGSLPDVRGETGQMTHVFQNLLSNALKYRRAGVVPEIHVSAELGGVDWTVSVSDNGIGFEKQYAERIFGLFKRLHKDEYPGTGLGLAICSRIVEKYGGRIWAEGRPGEGAIFRFSLPRIEEF